jgi:hypothetical protein
MLLIDRQLESDRSCNVQIKCEIGHLVQELKRGNVDSGGITILVGPKKGGISFRCLSCDRSMSRSKRVILIVRSSASSFKFQFLLFSSRSSSSRLRLHHILFPSVFQYHVLECSFYGICD